MQVAHADIDPVEHPASTTKYYAEMQWVSLDEATEASARNNNPSYREVVFSEGATCTYDIDFASGSENVTEEPAVEEWLAVSGVVGTEIDVDELPSGQTGRLILGAKATDLGTGWYQYEYALYNMNSHRAVESFTVPLVSGTSVCDIGFHDIDYHSGEENNVDVTDWEASGTATSITWAAQDPQGKEKNALRWGTLYNFHFRADAAPAGSQGNVTLGLFRAGPPGSPSSVTASTQVPGTPSSACSGSSGDCNENGLPDRWDVCCEESPDCNSNNVPDECDLAAGTSLDCDTTGVPDECEGCAAGCKCGGGCYECCTDAHCTDPNEPYCGTDFTAHTCVECLDNSDCYQPTKNCYCLETVGECYCCQTPPCPLAPGGK